MRYFYQLYIAINSAKNPRHRRAVILHPLKHSILVSATIPYFMFFLVFYHTLHNTNTYNIHNTNTYNMLTIKDKQGKTSVNFRTKLEHHEYQ